MGSEPKSTPRELHARNRRGCHGGGTSNTNRELCIQSMIIGCHGPEVEKSKDLLQDQKESDQSWWQFCMNKWIVGQNWSQRMLAFGVKMFQETT
jgi:hypothetical protein